MSAHGPALIVPDPALASAATAALATIRVQLGTAEQHIRQALERGARLRDQLARAGVPDAAGGPYPGPLAEADASIERARAALGELAS